MEKEIHDKVIKSCRSNVADIYSTYWLISGVALALIILSANFSDWSFVSKWFLLGFMTWNILEYGVHRFQFHRNNRRLPWNYITFGLHTYYHGKPSEAEYTPVPIRFSLSVVVLVTIVFSALSQNIIATSAAILGVILTYLYFEWIHARIHQTLPTNKLERFVHNYHLHHHFNSNKENYGLTFPFVDLLLGTANLSCLAKKYYLNK